MTATPNQASLAFADDDSAPLRPPFAADLAIERTRLLYQGSRVPTLFMLLNGLACACLLWGNSKPLA